MSRITSSVVAAFPFLATVAHAQIPEPVYQAPRAINDLFGVESAAAQELLLPPGRPDEFTLRVQFGGALRTMQLRPYEMRSPGFRLLVDDGVEIRQVETTPPSTYRGELVGERGSMVAASYVDGVLRAHMLSGGKTWTLQPVSDAQPGLLPGTYVVYEQADLKQLPFGCGVTEAPPPNPPTNPGAAAADGGHQIADLAIDADEPYYRHHGESVFAVQDEVLSIMNAADLIYNREVDIVHRISTILVRTVRTYTDGSTGLLSEFRNRWNSFHSDIDRDVAHLFSGRPNPGGTIGIAYVSAVCNRSRAYGVSWTTWTSNMQNRVGLTSHELGHNWGAGHCTGSPTCDIMCSTISGCGNNTTFGIDSTNQIESYRDSRGCLDTDPLPTVAPTISSITPSSLNVFSDDHVSLTGDDLDMVTAVTVGGVPAEFSIVGKGLLNVTVPLVDIATQVVEVSNSVGSDSIPVEIVGVHPSMLEAPASWVPDVPTTFRVHSDSNWQGLIAISLSPIPSVIPEVISLDLGNNFSQIVAIPVFTDSRGVAEVELTLPAGFPIFVRTHWQAVMFDDPNNLTYPLEVSDLALVVTWFF